MDHNRKVAPKNMDDQFMYEGKWVDKKHFRAFVYNAKDETRLAKSYKEFESLIASGLWFSEKPEPTVSSVPQGKRKKSHGTLCTTS